MKQLVTPWYGGQAGAGACLYMSQLVVRAGGGPYSATVAANATQYRHHDRNFPRTSICVLWFDHWGRYQDYRNGQFRYENWGHVVIWDPSAFGGTGGFFSSRRSGYGDGEWFRTVPEVEVSFSSKYRFWTEDLNGVRVCEPTSSEVTPPTPKPESVLEKKRMIVFYKNAYGAGKPGWLVMGFTPKPLLLSNQANANEWGRKIGQPKAIVTNYAGFCKYYEAAGASKAQINRVGK